MQWWGDPVKPPTPKPGGLVQPGTKRGEGLGAYPPARLKLRVSQEQKLIAIANPVENRIRKSQVLLFFRLVFQERPGVKNGKFVSVVMRVRLHETDTGEPDPNQVSDLVSGAYPTRIGDRQPCQDLRNLTHPVESSLSQGNRHPREPSLH
jgi:hypothetical protein